VSYLIARSCGLPGVCRGVGSCTPLQKLSIRALYGEALGRPYKTLHPYIEPRGCQTAFWVGRLGGVGHLTRVGRRYVST